MFNAFFDESGTHADSAVVVVGGYVASEKQWREFDSEWEVLLRREGVPAFHRVELENLKGPFARENGWDEARRTHVLQAAHDIIKRRTAVGTGGALIQADYEAVMPPVAKRAFGTAYGWLVHECIVGVGHWAMKHGHKEPIEYVFESGARGRQAVDRIFKSLYDDLKFREMCRIGGWRFVSKHDAVELQSADFFAYEVRKHVMNRIVDVSLRRPIRKSALDLFRPRDQAHYWDKARFHRWVEKSAPFISILEERERTLRNLGRPDLI